MRYCKEKKREKHLEGHLLPYLPLIISKCKEGKGPLTTFGSLLILQEMVLTEGNSYFGKILEEMVAKRHIVKGIADLLNNPQINKL